MDLLIDHNNNIICYCDDENYNCINLDKCKNKKIITDNLPLLITKNYKLNSKCNSNMIEPMIFKKLLDYIIKCNNNSNDRIGFLISFYYLLIKNINLIESLYFFYEHFVVYAYTSLKYNILINYKYVKKLNDFFIKHFNTDENNTECLEILNEWCCIFENLIMKEN
jgi:hypothetical protein